MQHITQCNMKYTNQQHKFICELIWGGVPVDRKWVEDTTLYKDSAPIIIEKYPMLDKSFYESKTK